MNAKQLSRDNWLALGVVALLLLVLLGVALTEQEEAMPDYSTISTETRGARALWLWTQELGYDTVDARAFLFTGPPPEADVALILEPALRLGDADWLVLDEWVNNGGTLIVAGDELNTRLAFSRYGLNLTFFGLGGTAGVQLPSLAAPPIVEPLNLQAFSYFEPEADEVLDSMVVHVAQDDRPIIVSLAQGEGRLILSSTAYPFTNVGLRTAGNAQLVRNLLATAVPSGLIWFNDWHHGLRGAIDPGELSGPIDWLRFTSGGQAVLYTAVLLFVAILLSGRAFGRPVPLPSAIRRRAPLEYINAIANLNRRAGHSYPVQIQYHQQIKRTLGRRYRLDPNLPDDEYLHQLAAYDSNLDLDQLTTLLVRLRQRDLSQADLLELAQESYSVLNDERT